MPSAKAPANVFKPDDHLVALLLTRPPEVRAKMLIDVILGQAANPGLPALVASLFQRLESGGAAAAEVEELKARYLQALAEFQNGPARPATFIAEADGELPGPRPRAHVVTPDGQERFPSLHPEVAIDRLEPGMTVYLDAQGTIVLGAGRSMAHVGQEATFLRRLEGTDLVEAAVRDEKLVLHAAQPVLDAEQGGTLAHGDRLLICPRRQFAFAVIPGERDRRHRFVDRGKLPDVVAARDIGQPHWALGWLVRRTRILLFRPDLLQRFDLRPRCSLLMTGPTGTGKTLTIRAYLHEFDRMLVERTGRQDVGSRVVRAKVPELLSEWLGRSDKNIEELFDDIQAVASEEVTTASGEALRLPVVVILEEAEGIARRRGEFDGGVYDRILGTLLQRLDDPTEDLGKLPLVLITTSNRPDLIDSAMMRRLAGMHARFSRLDRAGVAAVLDKKLRPHYPYVSRNGDSAEELRSRLIDQAVAWLYSPNAEDGGLVEITLRDGKKLVKYRRDFVTGAVIEQALSGCIDRAVFQAEDGAEEAGLTAGGLIQALGRQLDGLANNLTAGNAADYVDLPDHAHIATVRRLRGPSRLPHDLITSE